MRINNEVSEGYVFTTVCQSFCSQGAHTQGGSWGGLAGVGVSRPTPRADVQVHTRGGVSRPRPEAVDPSMH